MNLIIKRKKHCIFYLFLFLTISVITSQEQLYVGSNGLISISSGGALYANHDVIVESDGLLKINSDATSSGSLLVAGTVNGNISYARYINDTNWHLVSSPVGAQSIPSFVANAANSINTNPVTGNYAVAYYKNTNLSNTQWTYHNDSPVENNQETLVDFVNGQGYSMNRASSGNYIFTGTMATEDVTLSLTTASGDHYWHSVGNPYPSFLPLNSGAGDINVLGQNLSILDPSFVGVYFWNGTNYEVINQLSESLYLHPGQAFMVRVQDEDETFVFSENLQSHQNGVTNFYRGSPTSLPTIIVNLSNGSEQKTTELKYIDSATTRLDPGYDAGTYNQGTPSFSLDTHLVEESQGIDFMLQCLPDNQYESLIVPLSVRAATNSSLTFNATATNLPEGVEVYLQDTATNTVTNISKEPYQVSPSEVLNGVGRFYLHTSENTLGTDSSTNGLVTIFKTHNENLRITGLQDQEEISIGMYSITGSVVLQERLTAKPVQDITLPKSLSSGLYLIQLISETGVHTKKIIINNN